jgi:hypothetical protein
VSRFIPVEPEKWAEMVKAMGVVKELNADIDRLRDRHGELCAENARLKDEVERLTKAGDVLYNSMMEIGCNEMADNFQHDAWFGSMKDWNAAKEGGQP